MQLKVKFKDACFTDGCDMYTCFIVSASITQRNTKITSIKGKHLKNKTKDDIEFVCINDSTIKFFPQGLNNFFPHLRGVSISKCGLKSISREDLVGLEEIEELFLNDNKLTSLPDDLFVDMKKLEVISFVNNRLKYISSELLQPIETKLISAFFSDNKTIDALYSRDDPKGISLKELMKIIDTQCQKQAVNESITPEDTLARDEIQEPIAEAQMSMNTSPSVPISNLHEIVKESYLSGAKQMWNSGSLSDLKITAGTKEFKVHKCILSMHSPIVAGMLMNDPETSEIKVNITSEVVVERFLKYLYTGEITEEENCAMELFTLSAEFGIKNLESKFENIAYKNINDANAFEVFKIAHKHSSDKLKQKSFIELKKLLPFEELNDEMVDDLEGVTILYEGTKNLLSVFRARKRKMS